MHQLSLAALWHRYMENNFVEFFVFVLRFISVKTLLIFSLSRTGITGIRVMNEYIKNITTDPLDQSDTKTFFLKGSVGLRGKT